MAVEPLRRRLAAILSADVVGYSRLMGIDEAGTLSRLNALRRELIDPTIAAQFGGNRQAHGRRRVRGIRKRRGRRHLRHRNPETSGLWPAERPVDHGLDEGGPRQNVLDLDAGMNGKQRTAIRQSLIDGFRGIATIIIDTCGSGLDAAIAQHTAFEKGICDDSPRGRGKGGLGQQRLNLSLRQALVVDYRTNVGNTIHEINPSILC